MNMELSFRNIHAQNAGVILLFVRQFRWGHRIGIVALRKIAQVMTQIEMLISILVHELMLAS